MRCRISVHSFTLSLEKNKEVYTESLRKIVDKHYKDILPIDFIESYKTYIVDEKMSDLKESDLVIRLSHQLSLRQEYKIVKSAGYGTFFLDHEEDGDAIDKNINKICSELGLKDFLNEDGSVQDEELDLILKLIDRLRYQVRWSQTPRVPATSVLGHSFFVAAASYFAVKNRYASKRVVNNFYASLMHDFMESLTRDIISSVKNSSKEFSNEINAIEMEMLDEILLPKLSGFYKSYLGMVLRDEFKNKAYNQGSIVENVNPQNLDDYDYYFDGELVQASDYFAALLEAHQSISLGISSHHLVGAISRLYATFKSKEFSFKDKQLYTDYPSIYDNFISK